MEGGMDEGWMDGGMENTKARETVASCRVFTSRNPTDVYGLPRYEFIISAGTLRNYITELITDEFLTSSLTEIRFLTSKIRLQLVKTNYSLLTSSNNM